MDKAAPMQMSSDAKSLLWCVSYHCCRYCGLIWLGIPRMVLECCMNEHRIRAAIAELEQRGLLQARFFLKGGRGKTTEYVVLPGHLALQAPRCNKCVENQSKTPTPGSGFDKGNTPTPGSGYRSIPRGKRPQNPEPTFDPLTERNPASLDGVTGSKNAKVDSDQLSVQHQLSGSQARRRGLRASPSAAVTTPPISDPPRDPRISQDALQRVNAMVRDAKDRDRLNRPAAGIGGSLEKPDEGRGARKVPGAGEGGFSGVAQEPEAGSS
jgi:hypothetical protein